MEAGIRRFLGACPLIAGKTLHLDYLPGEPGSFSLAPSPGSTVLTEYMDGGQRRQEIYALGVRRYFGADVDSQRENLRWFRDFDRWLREKNRRGELPELGEDALCLSLTAADGGYVMEAGDGGMGRYQVELRMVYFQAAPGGKEV